MLDMFQDQAPALVLEYCAASCLPPCLNWHLCFQCGAQVHQGTATAQVHLRTQSQKVTVDLVVLCDCVLRWT